jgi:hypothetical protein
MRKEPPIITQKEIDSVWGNSDFGDNISRLDVVRYGLLKAAGGWHQGHTSTQILIELGLIKKIKKGIIITFKGKRNLYQFFKNDKKNI